MFFSFNFFFPKLEIVLQSDSRRILGNNYTPMCFGNFSGSSGSGLQSGWLTEDTVVISFIFMYFVTDSVYLCEGVL